MSRLGGFPGLGKKGQLAVCHVTAEVGMVDF